MDYIRAPSRLQKYLKDPRAYYYYLNKSMRKPWLRNLSFLFVRWMLPKTGPAPYNHKRFWQVMNNGITLWDDFADAGALSRIHMFLKDKVVYDARDASQVPLRLTASVPGNGIKLCFFDYDIAACEDIVRLANDGRVISLVSNYLGCKPTITIMQAWWTKAGAEAANPPFQDDLYHRDAEDFKFIKLFVYLTDVVAENGAHSYVKGSHRSTLLTGRGVISEAVVAQSFSAEDRLTLTGKAGMAFLEDTWGIHRSLPATRGERLILSVTYGLTGFNPQSPKRPVGQNRFGVDGYTNRIYLTP